MDPEIIGAWFAIIGGIYGAYKALSGWYRGRCNRLETDLPGTWGNEGDLTPVEPITHRVEIEISEIGDDGKFGATIQSENLETGERSGMLSINAAPNVISQSVTGVLIYIRSAGTNANGEPSVHEVGAVIIGLKDGELHCRFIETRHGSFPNQVTLHRYK